MFGRNWPHFLWRGWVGARTTNKQASKQKKKKKKKNQRSHCYWTLVKGEIRNCSRSSLVWAWFVWGCQQAWIWINIIAQWSHLCFSLCCRSGVLTVMCKDSPSLRLYDIRHAMMGQLVVLWFSVGTLIHELNRTNSVKQSHSGTDEQTVIISPLYWHFLYYLCIS